MPLWDEAGLILRGSSHGERRAEQTSLKRSLAFWSSSTARLRAWRKDLKNQLPEIITFSQAQLMSNKWASVEPPPPPLHFSPPPLHINTLIHTEPTHTHTQSHLGLFLKLFCPFFVSVSLVFFTCGTVTLAASGTYITSVGVTQTPQTCCESTSGLCPPRSAEGGGSELLGLPSGKGLGWNQKG